jgi:hypothetical protein
MSLKPTSLALALAIALGAQGQAIAQARGPQATATPPAPTPATPASARKIAPLDLSGYWVAVVTEDWRYRMITPDKGDFPGVPLNAAGRDLANKWDPTEDEKAGTQCKAYGAVAIMRVPTRLHITWQDDNTLRVDADAGTQSRLFHFGGTAPERVEPTWQGYSVASWEGLPPRGFVLSTVRASVNQEQRAPEGYLKVITTGLRPGYLRKNGVPYGSRASVEEYLDSFHEPNGDTWLIVTSIVTDPDYLTGQFITSSQFKKQRDDAGWHPSPCVAR